MILFSVGKCAPPPPPPHQEAGYATLPYSDKRKQLLKMTFLVNEQNVCVMYIDINVILLCLDLNIFQQEGCFYSKLGLEVEHAKSNLKTSLSQIWVIVTCFLLLE